MRVGVRLRLGLVADDDVGVGQDLVERVFEDGGDERGGEGEDEFLDFLLSTLAFTLFILFKRYILSCQAASTLFFAAASSARAMIAGTQTVRW